MTSPYMPSEYVLSARADSPTRQLRIDGALARDPAGIGELRELIHGLVDEGRTVLLSSHLLDEIERTCDAVAIVNDGKVIAQGTLDELTAGGPRAIDVARTQRDQAASLRSRGRRQADGAAAGSRCPRSGAASGPSVRRRPAVWSATCAMPDMARRACQSVVVSLEQRFLTMTTRLEERS